MDELTEVQNMKNVCRLCLSTEEPKFSIFADRAASLSLAAKIEASLSIPISMNDKLSTLVCTNCVKRVNQWHIYKESCQRSQEKLQKWLCEEFVANIKSEPMEFEDPLGCTEMVPITSDEEWETINEECNDSMDATISTNIDDSRQLRASTSIKSEPSVAEEKRASIEGEFMERMELLVNPLAVAGNMEDRVMEADSTQKLLNSSSPKEAKKRVKRGPRTHYRGSRQFKQKCSFCQIFLHSKYSYDCHMNRFHTDKPKQKELKGEKEEEFKEDHSRKLCSSNDDLNDEEMIEDVEDELISLEKDSPLTPVQQNIISQLKTFSCYSCQQYFDDRRSTLHHIRQHMPDLRPYTCIACLTEFADRSIYKLHCSASFQCAMKIALVIPEHGTEKYFTCNMCLRPLTNRKELLSHLSKHSDSQYEQLVAGPFKSPPKLKPITNSPSSTREKDEKKNSPKKSFVSVPAIWKKKNVPAPYKNGDPAHNNMCIYCGMIYRYKLNQQKHQELCKRLPPNDRTCYRCIQCGMTFLAFNKFHSHIILQHKQQELPCFHCNAKFKKPSDFLLHYPQHRINKVLVNGSASVDKDTAQSERNKFWDSRMQRWRDCTGKFNASNNAVAKPINNTNNYTCALCPNSSFFTHAQLLEHRKIHLKFNIYSCTVCQRMFGRAAALEAHMADHTMETSKDGIAGNTSLPAIKYNAKKNDWSQNANTSRILNNSDPGTNNTECHTCGKVFASYRNLRRHIRTAHDAVGRFSCFTCAKTFKTEDEWVNHVENEHERFDSEVSCPLCPKAFENHQALNVHRENIHGANGGTHLACYICGKTFVNESSLKIHRGHHFRVNSRLSIGNFQQRQTQHQSNRRRSEPERKHKVKPAMLFPKTMKRSHEDEDPLANPSPVKIAKARKSFPNVSSVQQLQNILQCQVCEDHFTSVSQLRKHLWDIHCAKNKPEKPFLTKKFQCELCTNVLPDAESLESHINWHKSNPILSIKKAPEKSKTDPAQCDICGKFYSNRPTMWKHRRLHSKPIRVLTTRKNYTRKHLEGKGFTCDACDKVFATTSTLLKHKSVTHSQKPRQQQQDFLPTTSTPRRVSTTINRRDTKDVKPIRRNIDFDNERNDDDELSDSSNNSYVPKKQLTCSLCKKFLPSMKSLLKHRKRDHPNAQAEKSIKTESPKSESRILQDTATFQRSSKNPVPCTMCDKFFCNISYMKQHITKVHKKKYECTIDECKLSFDSIYIRDSHESSHTNIMFTCTLCSVHKFTRINMNNHILQVHKIDTESGSSKIQLYKKINLTNYVVRGTIGRHCPHCKIKYPNTKSLKIHYLKMHDTASLSR